MLSASEIERRVKAAEGAISYLEHGGPMWKEAMIWALRGMLEVYDHLTEQANAKEKAKP